MWVWVGGLINIHESALFKFRARGPLYYKIHTFLCVTSNFAVLRYEIYLVILALSLLQKREVFQ